MTSDELELHAHRIREFLNDEVVQKAIQVVKDAAYKAFIESKTDEDRRMAQAKSLVANDFELALQVVVDAGERAKTERERRERAPDTRPSTE